MRHLSAEDVYRHAHTQGTTMSLSTVYKVLSQFEQVGLLRRSELGQSHTVYELNDPAAARQGHLVCALSGKVIELHPVSYTHLDVYKRQMPMSCGATRALVITFWAMGPWPRLRKPMCGCCKV